MFSLETPKLLRSSPLPQHRLTDFLSSSHHFMMQKWYRELRLDATTAWVVMVSQANSRQERNGGEKFR